MPKHIFVTGGVVSSLGKGIASASIAKILEAKGLKVAMQKLDPYLNVDPGTMSPCQHGEVYVTDDGAETDLDLGHYERYTHSTYGRENNLTSGQVYFKVITKERRGDYLGGTVQVVPHITDTIKEGIRGVSKNKRYDVVITEIGGTVGDIESLPFLEAIRQFRHEVGRENSLFVHLTLVPYIRAAGELKTKPTQHSVGTLREIGIQPDILICRTEKKIDQPMKAKIALFCNVEPEAVIEARDVTSIYECPLMFKAEGIDKVICRKLRIEYKSGSLHAWKKEVVDIALRPRFSVKVAVVGKHTEIQDAYKSVYESLKHGGIANDSQVIIKRVNSDKPGTARSLSQLKDVSGILVPGAFDERGIEGKLLAIRYAREKKVPFFGICLGMQCAVIEFARNVLGMKGANSTEFNKKSPFPVISLSGEQEKAKDPGGTMRLGAYPCDVRKDTKAYRAYKAEQISERHRHRYEFNNEYRERFQKGGMKFSGISPNGKLVEMVELESHPWFVACQFHPEFKSKPDLAHPLFRDFIASALEFQKSNFPKSALKPVPAPTEVEEKTAAHE
ncbi:MAG TPA: CTP synthase [Candidatus Omnitrophota bacterium]|jgi:CTP synthase|nr:CTP synthase [Candidatus Omnitrophota bacterium]